MNLTTLGCILLTPFILLVVNFLVLLAVVTSTITSSFIFLRLTLLAIEMISGLTIESTNWVLSSCINKMKNYLKQRDETKPENTIIMRRKKLSSSSLSLSKLPYKATIKSRYSTSLPGTPDPESFI